MVVQREAIPQITEVPVAMGQVETVALELKDDLSLLTPIGPTKGVSAEAVFNGPFKAPITKGQEMGTLLITRDGLPDVTVPLVAAQSVATGGFMVKVTSAAKYLVERLNAGPQDAS